MWRVCPQNFSCAAPIVDKSNTEARLISVLRAPGVSMLGKYVTAE